MSFIKRLFAKNSEKASPQTVNDEDAKLPFFSLSPVYDADPDGHYGNALNWALKNRKEKSIRNIALTGPYGSGKSSIIKTFEKRCKDDKNDLHFLYISLATFKEEKSNTENPVNNQDNNFANSNSTVSQNDDRTTALRLVELSILQQIFYHEEDKDIPDSRFKKTKNLSKKKITALTVSIFIFALSIIYQWNPQVLKSAFRVEEVPNWFTVSLHYISLLFALTGGFYLLWNLIRPLRGIQLKKFNVQDLEFGIDENISKSILNDHLDEILYFFEVTKYNVVVIEDLDRFEQTEIFTKLRELNYLINQCRKTKREVAFVYAIRDDKFQENERTKFFDFIIPVIPVINGSNSSEIFLKIIKEHKYDIKDQLVEDIALFVDDMRLLYNIMNEYFLFSQKLGKLDQNKLLAMVVYKNLYPNDFVALSNGEGKLHKIFAEKDSYILTDDAKIEKRVLEIEEEIENIGLNQLKDTDELRKLYVLEYITDSTNIVAFEINSTRYSFMEMIEEENFQALVTNKARYFRAPEGYGSATVNVINIKFKEIEKKVDEVKTYAQRLQQVEGFWEGKIEELAREKEVLQRKKAKLRHFRIKELMVTGACKIDMGENIKQNQLVNILLRSGYIDEQYQDYASIFYDGSITSRDREFLINARASIDSPYDYKLENVDKLVSKIPLMEFERRYIFNYELLDFLLSKNHHLDRRKLFFNTLAEDGEISFPFIEGYMDNGKNVKLFVNQLAKSWTGIWKYISGLSTLNEERYALYFSRLIEYADLPDIQRVAEESNLKDVIENHEDFLSIIPSTEKLKGLITKLDVKFKNVLLAGKDSGLVDHIYKGNHYRIDADMISKIIDAKGANDNEDASVSRNYSIINESPCHELSDYIDNNLNEYIEKVWIEQPGEVVEDETYLVFMLNYEDLSLANKLAIIGKNNGKYSDLSQIEDKELIKKILELNKAEANWNNILHYYFISGKEFDDVMISFLSNNSNAKDLGSKRIEKSTPKIDKAEMESFIRKILTDERIEDGAHFLLTKASPYHFPDLDFEKLGQDKVSNLVDGKVLSVVPENYNLLREKYSDNLHIQLAEGRKSDFMDSLSQFELTANDVLAFLDSAEFSIDEKIKIFEMLNEEAVKASLKLCAKVGQMLISDHQFTVSKDLLTFILKYAMLVRQKVALLLLYFPKYQAEEIFEIISYWPAPYKDIITKGKRPLLDLTDNNMRFAQLLLANGSIATVKEEKNGIRINTFRK